MKKLLAASALALVLSAPLALHAEPDGPRGGKHMEKMLEGLPAEKAEAFRETLKASREQNKDKREQMKKLHEELKAIVTAPTFDKGAFLAKHKEINAVRAELSTARESAMAEALSGLTQAERTAVAENMKKRFKRKPHGDTEGGSEGGPEPKDD